MLVERSSAPSLREHVSRYCGFAEQTPGPLRRREGPGVDVVVVVSFGEEWLIDEERHTSFAAGLYEAQVTTEHGGRSHGIQIDLAPPAARMLFGVAMHELAQRTVPLADVLGEPSLAERLYETRSWPTRFELLDELIGSRLADARPPSAGVLWAWRRLGETSGRVPVGALAEELGWSRKRIAARFRDEIGLPPKAVAKLLRFERARKLAGRAPWAEIAVECGYYDQSHLIHDFRAITGRTPETFLQDTQRAAA